MNADIAKQWVQALRSGKYKQGTTALRRGNDTFCCLGVLCDLLSTPAFYVEDDDWYAYGEEGEQDAAYLPESVFKAVNFKSFGHTQDLARMNDQGESFSDIAKYIEQNWEQL